MITRLRGVRRRLGPDDSGFSLVELIVYSSLSVVVLAGLAILLTNTWKAQSEASTVADATTQGTLATQNIEKAMRNAQAFTVDSTQSVLNVHTTLSGVRECQSFRISGGSVQMINTSGAISAGTWRTLTKNAVRIGTTPFFQTPGAGIAYSIQLNTTASPVKFFGAPMPRAITGVTAPCW